MILKECFKNKDGPKLEEYFKIEDEPKLEEFYLNSHKTGNGIIAMCLVSSKEGMKSKERVNSEIKTCPVKERGRKKSIQSA